MKNFFKILLWGLILIVAVVGVLFALNRVNQIAMKNYIDSFARVEYDSRLTPKLDGEGNYFFTTDSDFRVMQLTDVHLGGGILSSGKDKMAINALAAMITEEKPDLVIITGDMAAAYPNSGTMNNEFAHSYVIRIMERLGVYWTVTLGNHDSEAYNFLSRKQVADMYGAEELEYCLFSAGPQDIGGQGNHIINVKDSRGIVTQSFIMMDSHAYTDDDPLGLKWDYDYIKPAQIDWYEGIINHYSAENQSILKELYDNDIPKEDQVYSTVKSMLFIHIPLLETRDAYHEYVNNNKQNTENVEFLGGDDGEDMPMVYSSETDTEMFEKMLELDSTKAMFYGHDHLNNFMLNYKGVVMSYGYSMDYFAYIGIHKTGKQRGCSVITVRPDTTFEIVHENYYQDKYTPLYEKESVEDMK